MLDTNQTTVENPLRYQVGIRCDEPADFIPYEITKLRQSVINAGEHNFRSWRKELPSKFSIDEMTNMLTNAMVSALNTFGKTTNLPDDECVIRRYDFSSTVVQFTARFSSFESPSLMVFLFVDDPDDEYEEADINNVDGIGSKLGVSMVDIQAHGVEGALLSFKSEFQTGLQEASNNSKSALVRWIFPDGRTVGSKTFKLHKDWELKEIFYPWLNIGTDKIDQTLQSYYKAYRDSKAQIIVVYGPPGTGKTSFIRDMLCELGMNAFISFDSKVLTSDSTFVNYCTDSNFDAIVIEDADDLLTAGRGDNNKTIAKILNVSNGLIQLPKKKLIFTTNLQKLSDIDPAILRPGRCFDVMEFRTMTRDEAQVVADDLGVTLPDGPSKFTLAEVFQRRHIAESDAPYVSRGLTNVIKSAKMGF